jgi:hypothetical protein
MRILILAISLIILSGCAAKPGDEKWCEAKKAQPKSEWTGDDAKTYASHCVLDSRTIGSEEWCEKLADKPKGEWTTSETGDYAKHCVI